MISYIQITFEKGLGCVLVIPFHEVLRCILCLKQGRKMIFAKNSVFRERVVNVLCCGSRAMHLIFKTPGYQEEGGRPIHKNSEPDACIPLPTIKGYSFTLAP